MGEQSVQTDKPKEEFHFLVYRRISDTYKETCLAIISSIGIESKKSLQPKGKVVESLLERCMKEASILELTCITQEYCRHL
jgi:hypothetical protein